MKKPFLAIIACAGFATLPGLTAWGQEAEDNGKVQYMLILPEEKTPEMVKPEEHNPFESASDGSKKDDSNSEENQVRDLLLRMRVGGAASGMHGMRVMLGGMRLEQGMEVPPVIPDQQVKLRVKSITTAAIELVWVETKPTGLPPKVLVIPMDGSPTVRYRMPAGGQSAEPVPSSSNGMGMLRRPDVSAFNPSPQPSAQPAQEVARGQPAAPQPAAESKQPQPPVPAPAPKPSTPPSPVPEASVLRMLFGNHPPEPK